MKSEILCLVALVAAFVAARRSLWSGIAVVLTFGYFYGILRANIPETASHFTFDAACFGLYLALLTRRLSSFQRYKIRRVLPWFIALMVWPVLIFLVPMQPIMVQLVGLRGQIFFLPFLLMGAMIADEEFYKLSLWIAALNLAAFGFALAEVVWGVPKFFPFSPVDALIYGSNDIRLAHTSDYRIPATFVQSAVYGGQMVATMPLLVGALVIAREWSWRRYLVVAAIAASAIGIFLTGSRTSASILVVMAAVVTFSGRLIDIPRYAWLLAMVVVVAIVAISPRMQRFLTLENTGYVVSRIGGSVNQNLIDLALEYPLGNGLGGGGTSLPYFLRDQVINPVAMESEYARIMLEQGLPGLALWIGFVIWVLTRPRPRPTQSWYTARWLARIYCAAGFLIAAIGTGTLTTVPGTAMLLLLSGWITVPQLVRERVAASGWPVSRANRGEILREA